MPSSPERARTSCSPATTSSARTSCADSGPASRLRFCGRCCSSGSTNSWPPTLTRARGFLPAFYGRGLLTVDDPLYSHRLRFANSARCLHLLNPEFLAGAASETQTTERVLQGLPSHFAEMSPLSKAQYLEIATFMEGYLLHAQGDRMLMGNSVEGRFPYLDHRVADLAARLPDRLRLRGLQEKYALRAATSRYLPAEIRQRPKQPYRAPIGETLAGTAAPDYVRELLAPKQIDAAGLLDSTAVARLVRKFELGKGVSETDEMGLVGAVSSDAAPRTVRLESAGGPASSSPAVLSSTAKSSAQTRLQPSGRPSDATRPELLVQDSLLGAAEVAPARDAVVDEFGPWTYEQLADEALRIARLLQDEGLQPGDRVALCLDNTARCVAGIFGTLIAGGVFIGVSPQTRAEKLALILADSDAAFLIAEGHAVNVVAEAVAQRGSATRVFATGSAAGASGVPEPRRGARCNGAAARDSGGEARQSGRTRLHVRHDRTAEGSDAEPPGARVRHRQHRRVPAPRRR